MPEVNIEEAAAESEQDRRDHRKLAGNVELLLQHEHVMRVPLAVRRLVDAGIDPLVVAKTLVIGDRPGGEMYLLSHPGPVRFALGEHEQLAVDWVTIAIRDIEPDLGTMMLVAGATWLATQFGIERKLLADLVRAAYRRALRLDRRGYGAVDLVDHHGVGDRSSITTAIELAQLPMFAPLVGSPFEAS